MKSNMKYENKSKYESNPLKIKNNMNVMNYLFLVFNVEII